MATLQTIPDRLRGRTLQFAVGCVVIVLLIRWLLTGDLLMVAEAIRPVEEGQTKAIPIFSVIVPMAIEAIIVIGAAVVAGWLKLWAFLAASVETATGSRPTAPASDSINPANLPASEPVKAKQVTSPPAVKSPNDSARDLLRAVALGDDAEVDRLRAVIRRPYVLADIQKALAVQDHSSASGFMEELRKMDQASPTKPATRSTRAK
jgi:hypothetical protein